VRRQPSRPRPRGAPKPSTVPPKSTPIHDVAPPFRQRPPRPPTPQPSLRPPRARKVPKREIARILDDEATVLDLIDNLLNKGVVLNADVILALANVDLVYLRVSALLCAADRVMPGAARRNMVRRRRPTRP
jgi:hypothetical protein